MMLLNILNLILIIALIIFSAWCFYLRFKSNRVCTIKDLLLAFVTGGALAVTTLVFGVTGEIMEISDEIKQDTSVIRTSLGEGEFPVITPREQSQDLSGIENNLGAIFELLQVNTQILQILEESQPQDLGGIESNIGNIFKMLGANSQTMRTLDSSHGQILGILTSEKESVPEGRLGVRLLETGFAVATVVEFQCLFSPTSGTPVCTVVAPNSGAARVQ